MTGAMTRTVRLLGPWRSLLTLLPSLGVLTVSLWVAGCATGQRGPDIRNTTGIQAGVTTKKQVYERLGVPTDVFPAPDDGKVLLYEREEGRGMALGLGYGLFPVIRIGHMHTGSDTLYVLVDREGVVQNVGVTTQATLADYRLWPFGQ